MRTILGKSAVQISTGGCGSIANSTQPQFFSCPSLQILALHNYDLTQSYIALHVDSAKTAVMASGQRLLYEEFGANKQSSIQSVTDVLIAVRQWHIA